MRFLRNIHQSYLLESFDSNKVKGSFKRLFFTSRFTFDQENSLYNDKSGNSKILKVAIIGSPNAGKSTVINQVVRRRIFAISKKVHTTQCCARAVLNEGLTQIIFLDTPGLVTSKEYEKYKLRRSYFTGGEEAIVEADLIGVVHDVSNTFLRDRIDPKALRLLHLYKEKDSILILNKVDALKSKKLLLDLSNKLTKGKLRRGPSSIKSEKLSELDVHKLMNKESYWEYFNDVFMVSALLGNGVNDLRNYLLDLARPGEWVFPADTYTDKNPVHIIEETVRSKFLEHLPQEVPYSLDIQLEYLDMDNEELITAVVLVFYNVDRTERLIKGHGGGRIKMIVSEAEQEIADAFLSDVHLRIVLKQKDKLKEVSSST